MLHKWSPLPLQVQGHVDDAMAKGAEALTGAD